MNKDSFTPIIFICLFNTIFIYSLSLAVVWPISNSTDNNKDVVTSPFGPRNNNGKYQIHYWNVSKESIQ